jgi:hypothetical protein
MTAFRPPRLFKGMNGLGSQTCLYPDSTYSVSDISSILKNLLSFVFIDIAGCTLRIRVVLSFPEQMPPPRLRFPESDGLHRSPAIGPTGTPPLARLRTGSDPGWGSGPARQKSPLLRLGGVTPEASGWFAVPDFALGQGAIPNDPRIRCQVPGIRCQQTPTPAVRTSDLGPRD